MQIYLPLKSSWCFEEVHAWVVVAIRVVILTQSHVLVFAYEVKLTYREAERPSVARQSLWSTSLPHSYGYSHSFDFVEDHGGVNTVLKDEVYMNPVIRLPLASMGFRCIVGKDYMWALNGPPSTNWLVWLFALNQHPTSRWAFQMEACMPYSYVGQIR